MSAQSAYMARQRQKWKAEGRCRYCGRDSEGKRRCERCRESLRLQTQRRRAKQR